MFKDTFRYIRRSPYQSFAAVSVMVLTFVITGLFFLISLGSSTVLKYFETRPEIIIFFKDSKKAEDIKALEEQYQKNDKVAKAKYVSKDEALDIYKEQFKKDPMLLEMVSADILPASLEISTKKVGDLAELVKPFKNDPDVSDIAFPEDVVNLLSSWTKSIRIFGLGLVIFLGVVSLFTVVTVISMKIAIRREEIEILQLIGATAGYIKKPFLFEGMLYGIVGAFIGWGANVAILISSSSFLASLFVGVPIFPIPWYFYAYFFGGMILAGLLLGLFASLIAINRYLGKVK